MSDLTPDELMEIVMASEPGGVWEQAEEALRGLGRSDLAEEIIKLQQDAGLELDPAFNPDDRSNPPGPSTAALWAAYEPVTRVRYDSIMQRVKAALEPNAPRLGEPG